MEKSLFLSFHGRIIDHLGIQMYQSPTAAIAEMVSNSWDADATEVKITLPTHDDFSITIQDNGIGMTLEECQNKFLTVGYDKRKNNAKTLSRDLKRPLMGRKGIGKFGNDSNLLIVFYVQIRGLTLSGTKTHVKGFWS